MRSRFTQSVWNGRLTCPWEIDRKPPPIPLNKDRNRVSGFLWVTHLQIWVKLENSLYLVGTKLYVASCHLKQHFFGLFIHTWESQTCEYKQGNENGQDILTCLQDGHSQSDMFWPVSVCSELLLKQLADMSHTPDRTLRLHTNVIWTVFKTWWVLYLHVVSCLGFATKIQIWGGMSKTESGGRN